VEIIAPKPEKKKAPKINSRAKGGSGEREWANLLKSYGIQARRGQQFKGTKDSPDVETELKHLHFEVKRVEKLNISKANVLFPERPCRRFTHFFLPCPFDIERSKPCRVEHYSSCSNL